MGGRSMPRAPGLGSVEVAGRLGQVLHVRDPFGRQGAESGDGEHAGRVAPQVGAAAMRIAGHRGVGGGRRVAGLHRLTVVVALNGMAGGRCHAGQGARGMAEEGHLRPEQRDHRQERQTGSPAGATEAFHPGGDPTPAAGAGIDAGQSGACRGRGWSRPRWRIDRRPHHRHPRQMDLRPRQLKNYLRDLRGDDQVDLFRFSLRSLLDRIDYARYHFDEAKRLMSPYTSGDGPKPGDDHRPFRTALTQTAAHSLACLQSLHACADICAHVVYYGLGSNLDPKPLKEQQIDARKVLERIPDHPVSHALRRLVEDPEFEYLDAVVNRSKHRTVTSTLYTFESGDSVEDRAWHGVKLWRFERSGKSYPSRRSEEFLATEIERQCDGLSAVCATLEKHLRAEWEEQKRLHEARGDRWPPPRILGDSDDG